MFDFSTIKPATNLQTCGIGGLTMDFSRKFSTKERISDEYCKYDWFLVFTSPKGGINVEATRMVQKVRVTCSPLHTICRKLVDHLNIKTTTQI